MQSPRFAPAFKRGHPQTDGVYGIVRDPTSTEFSHTTGLKVSSVTAAALFRLIDKYKPTLIADEADTWLSDEKSELRGIYNAGHARKDAYVVRCVGVDHYVKLFGVFTPRVLAMIGRPPATIVDRSIVVELARKRPDEAVDRMRQDRFEAATLPLRQKWRRWADDHTNRLKDADPAVPAVLNDRAADSWRALLAVADLAGDDWPLRARAAATTSVNVTAKEAESINVELLADIRRVFRDRPSRLWLSSGELTSALTGLEDRPWRECSHGKPLTQFKLSGHLKAFKVQTKKTRDGDKTVNAYRAAALADAWVRYLPIESEHSEQTNVYGAESTILKSEQNPNVPSQTAPEAENHGRNHGLDACPLFRALA